MMYLNFFYNGKISSSNLNEIIKISDNLTKIFGYQGKLPFFEEQKTTSIKINTEESSKVFSEEYDVKNETNLGEEAKYVKSDVKPSINQSDVGLPFYIKPFNEANETLRHSVTFSIKFFST